MANEQVHWNVLNRLPMLVAIAICAFAQAAGTYVGNWNSATAGSGKLTFSFTGGKLTEATVTIRGISIDAKPILSKVDKTQYSFTLSYEVDGNALRTTMIGTLAEGSMKGSYRTQTESGGEPLDEGTWEVTQQ